MEKGPDDENRFITFFLFQSSENPNKFEFFKFQNLTRSLNVNKLAARTS